MNFRREKNRNLYLQDTEVENIFLMEYMTDAEGDFIKVYLIALMYADYQEMTNHMIARHLGIGEADVLRAWDYWEKKGVIRKHRLSKEDRFHYTIEFLSMKDRMFDRNRSEQPVKDEAGFPPEMDDQTLRDLFQQIETITGRLLSGTEAPELIDMIYRQEVEADLILYAYEYSVKEKGHNEFSYVKGVLRGWNSDGIHTVKEAEEHLSEYDQRHNLYKRVLKALGFQGRQATEEEKRKMDTWFDDMGFGIDKVLEACARTSGISNPNINYVNSVLRNWSGQSQSPGSGRKGQGEKGERQPDQRSAVSRVLSMYDASKRRNQDLLDSHRREIAEKIPRITEIEKALRRISMDITRLAVEGESGGEAARACQMRIRELNQEKSDLLKQHGYDNSYLEMQYDCKLCKDTGVREDGARCSCFAEKMQSLRS